MADGERAWISRPATGALEIDAGEGPAMADDLYEPELVTLEEASARVPFTLWFPRGLAEGWEHEVALFPGDEEGPPGVVVHLWHSVTPHELTIAQREAGPAPDEWDDDLPDEPVETMQRDGELLSVSQRSPDRRDSRVVLERKGTWIDLGSRTLPPESLLELVGSLEPVPRR